MARAEQPGLHELVGRNWQCAHHVEIRAEIVERSVRVAKDLNVHGRLADILTVSFDAGAGRRGIYENVVSHGVVRASFSARRDGSSTSYKYEHRGQARGGNPLVTHGLKNAPKFGFPQQKFTPLPD